MGANVDIVILGAGAAGMGAARRLAGSGLTTVLLEASSRPGGRAWTREINGFELDMGAGWLHSADRNALSALAADAGIPIDRTPPAWGVQFRDLGFTSEEQSAARKAYDDWLRRLATAPPANDCAADALAPGEYWNSYVRTIAGFISGAGVERLSAADYVAYDDCSTEANWRVPTGYGALIAQGLPAGVTLRLATPVEALELEAGAVEVSTRTGSIRARAVIFTASTGVLAGDTIKLPSELDPWREAARRLPLGHTEKFFLEITGDSPFEPDTQVLGNPRDPNTGSYYLRPFGRPLVECFVSAEGTRLLDDGGPSAVFTYALDQLSALFGAEIRRVLRPLAASNWGRSLRIGGAYSYALPGHAKARAELARPFERRVFFAGEATSRGDYSTVHGAYDTGVRAAEEALAALGASA